MTSYSVRSGGGNVSYLSPLRAEYGAMVASTKNGVARVTKVTREPTPEAPHADSPGRVVAVYEQGERVVGLDATAW